MLSEACSSGSKVARITADGGHRGAAGNTVPGLCSLGWLFCFGGDSYRPSMLLVRSTSGMYMSGDASRCTKQRPKARSEVNHQDRRGSSSILSATNADDTNNSPLPKVENLFCQSVALAAAGDHAVATPHDKYFL